MAKAAKKSVKKRTGIGSRTIKQAAARTFMGIRIVDPVVKPQGTTVKKIREAVEMARLKRT